MPRETVNSSRNLRDSLQIIKLIIQSAYSLRCCPVSMRSFLRVEERTLGTRLVRSLFPLSHEPSLSLGTCEDQDGGTVEVR